MDKLSVLFFSLFLTISCGGGGGSSEENAINTTSITSNQTSPGINFASSENSVEIYSDLKLTWSSSNTSECSAEGAWSGSKPLSGEELVNLSTEGDLTFNLTCTGTNGSSISKSLTVESYFVRLELPEGPFSVSKSYKIHDDTVLIGAFGSSLAGEAHLFNLLNGELLHTFINPNPSCQSCEDLFGRQVFIDDEYIAISSPNLEPRIHIFDPRSFVLLETINAEIISAAENAFNALPNNFGVFPFFIKDKHLFASYENGVLKYDLENKQWLSKYVNTPLDFMWDPKEYDSGYGSNETGKHNVTENSFVGQVSDRFISHSDSGFCSSFPFEELRSHSEPLKWTCPAGANITEPVTGTWYIRSNSPLLHMSHDSNFLVTGGTFYPEWWDGNRKYWNNDGIGDVREIKFNYGYTGRVYLWDINTNTLLRNITDVIGRNLGSPTLWEYDPVSDGMDISIKNNFLIVGQPGLMEDSDVTEYDDTKGKAILYSIEPFSLLTEFITDSLNTKRFGTEVALNDEHAFIIGKNGDIFQYSLDSYEEIRSFKVPNSPDSLICNSLSIEVSNEYLVIYYKHNCNNNPEVNFVRIRL